jgi:hypothetical protein
MDPQVEQNLDGPSFCLSSELCLYNYFHGYFVPFYEGTKYPHFGLPSWVSCVLEIVSWVF